MLEKSEPRAKTAQMANTTLMMLDMVNWNANWKLWYDKCARGIYTCSHL